MTREKPLPCPVDVVLVSLFDEEGHSPWPSSCKIGRTVAMCPVCHDSRKKLTLYCKLLCKYC